MRIVLHTYTFHRYPLEHAVKKGLAYGYEAAELLDVFYREGTTEAIERAVDICEKGGLPVAALGSCVNFTGTPDEEKKSLESFQIVLDVAKRRGIPRINGNLGHLVGNDRDDYSANGSALLTDALFARAVEGARQVDTILEEADIDFTLEMHMNMAHDAGAVAMRILEQSGAKRISLNHDAGNLYSIDHAEEANECLNLIQKRMTYVHLKNCRNIKCGYSYNVRLGSGDIDYYRYLMRLKEIGYDGDLCIEYCGEGDPHIPAREDILYLRGVLEDLEMH